MFLIQKIRGIRLKKFSKKELQEFAWIWAIVLCLGGLLRCISKDGSTGSSFIIGSLFFLFLGFVFPFVLSPFYRVWIVFGRMLAFINTRIILFFFYYVILVPTGIVAKLFGYDPLVKKAIKDSFWSDMIEKPDLKKYY